LDPITLATATSALTVLACEVGKGVADSAGEDLWKKVKAILHWETEPKLPDLPVEIASQLSSDETAAQAVLSILKSAPVPTTAAALVSRIDANKVMVVSGNITVSRDFNFS